MIRRPFQSRRNRRKVQANTAPTYANATATNTVSANKWALAFSVPVIVNTLPTDFKVAGASPTGYAITDNQHILLTFAVNVATGQTYVIPTNSPNIRTGTGGYVTAATGTF